MTIKVLFVTACWKRR